jgi:hypothetical protein
VSGESKDYLNDLLLSPVVTVDETQLAELYYSTDTQRVKGFLEVYPATETGHVKYDRIMYKLPVAAEPLEGSTKVWIRSFLIFNSISDRISKCYLLTYLTRLSSFSCNAVHFRANYHSPQRNNLSIYSVLM